MFLYLLADYVNSNMAARAFEKELGENNRMLIKYMFLYVRDQDENISTGCIFCFII